MKELHATRKIMLLSADAACILLGAFIGIYMEFGRRAYIKLFEQHYYALPLMLIVFCILLNINNLFSLARKIFSEILLGITVNVLLTNIIIMAIGFFAREFIFSRKVLIYTFFAQFFLLAITNYIFWRWERKLSSPKNVLLIGDKQECALIINKMHIWGEQFNHNNICRAYKEAWLDIINEFDTVIVGATLSLVEKRDVLYKAHMHGKRVIVLPSIYGIFAQGMIMDYLDDIPVFKAPYLKPTAEQRMLKRSMDIVGATIGLIVLAPIMIATAAAVFVNSPGNPIYKQRRIGQNEEEFVMYKFRSMCLNAEKKTGAVLATANDPRITKVGAFIRRTRLDELPQLLNVLMGDMSLVGPRPERKIFVEHFKQEFPEYVYRHSIQPGITGMAQVYGKYNTTAYNKLIYDLMYIQKCNVFTDLSIIIQTVKVLFMKKSTEGVQ